MECGQYQCKYILYVFPVLQIFCILGCYKKLQILNASLNTAHASFLCPLNLTMFFTTSILTMFGAIRLKEVATLAEYILFPLACTFLLTLFSALLFGSELIYDYSSKLVSQLKRCQIYNDTGNARIQKMFRREVAAQKSFGIRFGTMQHLTKGTVLVIYERLLNYAVSLLITFPHSYFHK